MKLWPRVWCLVLLTHGVLIASIMAYQLMPFPMTLDDLEGHSTNAGGLIKCNSTNICATFSEVLPDTRSFGDS